MKFMLYSRDDVQEPKCFVGVLAPALCERVYTPLSATQALERDSACVFSAEDKAALIVEAEQHIKISGGVQVADAIEQAVAAGELDEADDAAIRLFALACALEITAGPEKRLHIIPLAKTHAELCDLMKDEAAGKAFLKGVFSSDKTRMVPQIMNFEAPLLFSRRQSGDSDASDVDQAAPTGRATPPGSTPSSPSASPRKPKAA